MKFGVFWAVVATWVLATHSVAATPNEVYDPRTVRSLHVQITERDYLTIRNDETFDIEVPATFWADGEAESYLISIRRKSATAIGDKISYRLKFQSRVGDANVKLWNGVKSLSLENGDDQNVVKEGLSWYLHRLASTSSYRPGLAAWTTLTLHVVVPVLDGFGQPSLDEAGNPVIVVNSRPQGVYLSVELPDKQFLRNRGLLVADKTWLYKQDDIGLPEIKVYPGDSTLPEASAPRSPADQYLRYSPFQTQVKSGKRVLNPTPADTALYSDLTQWIDMDSMLRLGAVNAFTGNPDELFNHGKNFFWIDYATDGSVADYRRQYLPWDLDAAIRSTTEGIYGALSGSGKKVTVTQHSYQQIILNHPSFRVEFNAIMLGLLNGPLSVTSMQAFLRDAEAVLTDPLLSDPNNKIGNTPEAIAAEFSSLRQWVEQRSTNVRSQIQKNGPPAPR